jgi:predicted PurR-regulated permease PerM
MPESAATIAQRIQRQPVAPASTPGGQLGLLPGVLLVIAVLYVARELLIPLVLAVLLSFVLAPVVRMLRRARLPGVVAVVASVTAAVALLAGLALVVGRQLTQLAASIPLYQAEISRKLDAVQGPGGWLDQLLEMAQQVSEGLGGKPDAAPPAIAPPGGVANPARPLPVEIHDPPSRPLELVQSVLEPLLYPLATFAIVVVLVIFVLLYREDLRDRLIRLVGARDLHRTVAAMDDAAWRLSRFFLAQTALNAAYGVAMTGALYALGVPQPVLWGIIAALMRFVPFVGTIVAAAPPLVLAMAVDPGWTMPLLVLALYAVGESAMGQVAEPLVFGRSTGLSPLAVVLAATFWTWLWGPLGLLLATPLTVCLVVLGRHVDQLEFLEVALSDRPPLDPPQAFYQRALAGDADGLAEQAELALKEKPLLGYLDEVVLPGLALAQGDARRQALDPPRIEEMRERLAALLEDLEEDDAPEEDAPPPPEAFRTAGSVLCVPARGCFDTEVAVALAQALSHRGFGRRWPRRCAQACRCRGSRASSGSARWRAVRALPRCAMRGAGCNAGCRMPRSSP